MPTPSAGLSIVEQYAARRQRARQDWALCMLIAMIPFCLFIWGPDFLKLPAGFSFGAIGIWGFNRQRKIDRCPACNSCRVPFSISIGGVGGRGFRPNPRYCDGCGVELNPDFGRPLG
jgi:hypothetical protein